MKKKRKKLAFLFAIAVFFGNFSNYSHASHTPKTDVAVNGEILDFDEKVFIKNSLTHIPLREMAENLGIFVDWNEEKRVATVKNNDNVLECYPDLKKVVLNGKENKNIVFENGKIFVSLRNISELLNGNLKWYDDVYLAQLTSLESFNVKNKKSYNKDDLFWMTKIISAESGGEPMIGKIAVGNVILNRVESKDFPNSVYEVVYDKKYGVQFEPVINGSILKSHSVDCITAAKRAFEGENYAGESLYFLNPKKATNFWISNNRTYFLTISNHDFYL